MNWEEFLQHNGIDYVTRGPNTKLGNISIQCPFCGHSDPSQHMGINLTQDKWGCWRESTHRGKNPTKLVQAILNCSWAQAKLLVAQYSSPDPDTLDESYLHLSGYDRPDKVEKKTLNIPDSFREIKNKGSTKKFFNYLSDRIDEKDIPFIIKRYNILCCNINVWKNRVIFPIYYKNKLVNWTGRSIQESIKAPRYRTLDEDNGALFNIKDTIYNEQNIKKGGKYLFILEGIFDVIKIDFYGKRLNVRATSIYGAELSENQIELISLYAKKYDKVFLMLDENTISQTLNASDKLTFIQNMNILQQPDFAEDPGEMSKNQVRRFLQKSVE